MIKKPEKKSGADLLKWANPDCRKHEEQQKKSTKEHISPKKHVFNLKVIQGFNGMKPTKN